MRPSRDGDDPHQADGPQRTRAVLFGLACILAVTLVTLVLLRGPAGDEPSFSEAPTTVPAAARADADVSRETHAPSSIEAASRQSDDATVAAGTGTVTGRVLDMFDRPIGGARVRAASGASRRWSFPDEPEVFATATADAAGAFRLAGVPFRPFFLYARAEGFVPGGSGSRELALIPARPVLEGIVIRMFEARELRGRVLDEKGSPVAGAHVLACLFDSRMPWPEWPEALTDAAGTFSLQPLPLGDLKMYAWKPELGSVDFRPVGAGTAEVELVIRSDQQASLRIEVEGDFDPPAATVRLSRMVRGYGQWMPSALQNHTVTVAAPVLLPRLLEGEYSVEVSHPKVTFEVRSPDRSFELQPGAAVTRVFRALPPVGVRVRGRLRDGAGNGLPGRQIQVTSSSWVHPRVSRSARTRADGAFECESPVAAGARVTVGLLDETLVLRSQEAQISVTVKPEEFLELTAVRAARLSGRVVGNGQEAVAGVEVRVFVNRDPQNMLVRAFTASEGRFEFPPLSPREDAVGVEVTDAAGYVSLEGVRLDEGGRRELLLELHPTTGFEGTVADAAGRPVPGSQVHTRRVDPTTGHQLDGRLHETWSGPDGRYRFFALRPSTWQVEVVADGMKARAARRVTVAAGQMVSGVDVVFPPPRVIAGVVRLAGGSPAARFDVLVWQGVARHEGVVGQTDSSGRFRLRVPADGEWRLTVSWPWVEKAADARLMTWRLHVGEEQEFAVRAGDESLDLRLPNDVGSLSARFVTEPGVELPQSVSVAPTIGGTEPVLERWSPFYIQQVRLENGVLRLARVEDRECGLRISHPEFQTLDVRVRVTAGRETDLGELRLVPAGRVRGRVVDARDVALTGVEVLVATDSGNEPARKPAGEPLARTDLDGRFDCRAVQATATTLVLWKDGFAPLRVTQRSGSDARSLELRMLAACALRIVLPAERSGYLQVRLVGREPGPEVGAYAAQLRSGLITQHWGSAPLLMAGLPPASYTLTVTRYEKGAPVVVAERVVETRAGETVTVDLSGR